MVVEQAVQDVLDVLGPDEMGEAIELLCRRYGCKVTLPCQGLDDSIFKQLTLSMAKRQVRVSWRSLTELERIYVASPVGAPVVADLLFFDPLEVLP